MERTYEVVLEPSEQGGFTVFVPGMRGCVSEGATEEEALENIKDAIQGWLEVWEEIEREEATWLRRTVVISR
ncbi:MAG: type II toxin-antitoxin system HicB family antitoxin [Chloroflexota bacterium]|nr:type II toxin-antitoxin system HicB family antitoxin [Chloroflexota bacterium]MDE2884056.1 type II toxin-antitoxin system HicB family antitoxin [Chloroflexota bacterium]